MMKRRRVRQRDPVFLSEDKHPMTPFGIHRTTNYQAELRRGMPGPSGSGEIADWSGNRWQA
jgi:hypothetical protein